MKKISLLFLLLLIFQNSFCSHIVGGGFEMLHIRGTMYQISLHLYVDAVHSQPGVIESEIDATIGIFEKGTNVMVRKAILPLRDRKNIPYLDSCRISHLNTDALTFYENIDLSGLNHPEGYYISYQNCCRNQVIENITDPVNEGIAYVYEFILPNSSPTIPTWGDDQVKIGENYTLNFSSKDPDGDSLAYKLVTPIAGFMDIIINTKRGTVNPGPYPLVNWKTANGFSSTNIIPGNPALKIDPVTGILEVNPSIKGSFVYAIETQEYRKKVKIASSIREYNMLVVDPAVSYDCLPPETNGNPNTDSPKPVLIYPNPARYIVNFNLASVEGQFSQIEIVDALGKSVAIIPAVPGSVIPFKTGTISPGLYFLIVKSTETTVRAPFIIRE